MAEISLSPGCEATQLKLYLQWLKTGRWGGCHESVYAVIWKSHGFITTNTEAPPPPRKFLTVHTGLLNVQNIPNVFCVQCGGKKKVFVFYANISKTVRISYQSVPSCRICRQTFYLHGWLQLEHQSQVGFILWCVMENGTKSSLCDSIHPKNFQDFILIFMSEYYLSI